MDRRMFIRIIKGGFVNFFRYGLVSMATVLVMSLSIFMLGSVLIGSVFLHGVIGDLEDKVDISVYFRKDVLEEEILQVRADLERLPEVAAVNYVSTDVALERFLSRHSGDALVLRSLEVVEENPFTASLEIKAHDTSQFEIISVFLESSPFSALIETDPTGVKKITYRQNKAAIDQLSNILSATRFIGFTISLILAAIAIMVAYNTIRLAIYSSRDEISIMQLVGASQTFVKGPFIVEGVIHGVIASALTISIFYPILWWLGGKTVAIFGGLNVYAYYSSNIVQIAIILLTVGILIGVLSSSIATRRYLKT
jgi:cell division transport system permease protein